jgi:serine/threonine protein kinase
MKKQDKLLGEGSYGCVFTPAIKCKGTRPISVLNTLTYPNYVSKVFTDIYDQTAFNREAELARLVNKWDPQAHYFGVPNKICTADISDINKNAEADQCDELTYIPPSITELKQIVMPYYGDRVDYYLENYMIEKNSKFPLDLWIKSIKNIVEAVFILQTHNYVHFDIKSANVLFDGIHLKLLDFSLIAKYDEIYTEKHKDRLNFSYFPYPLEFLLVYYNLYEKCDSCIYDSYLTSLQTKFGSHAYPSFIKFHSETEIKATIVELSKWIKNNKKIWLNEIYRRIPNIDIYSIGTLCIHNDYLLDYTKVSPKIQQNYKLFVKKLSHLDFRHRPNAMQALQLYNKLFL